MALIEILEEILQGEAYQTFSMEVMTENVKRGMAVAIADNGKIRPAQAGDRVIGVAKYDADIGEKCTFALTLSGAFVARMILTESQTVEAGDALKAGSMTISGVTTNGLVAKQTDAPIADITDTFATWTGKFTDFALGATPSGSDINTAANALIDEIEGAGNGLLTELAGLIGNLSDMVDEVKGIQTQAKSYVGLALEDKTTTTDETKQIKVLIAGPSL